MQASKTTKKSLIIGGLVLLVFSLCADLIGVGNNPGFGPSQTTGSVLGVIISAVGYFLKVKNESTAG